MKYLQYIKNESSDYKKKISLRKYSKLEKVEAYRYLTKKFNFHYIIITRVDIRFRFKVS